MILVFSLITTAVGQRSYNRDTRDHLSYPPDILSKVDTFLKKYPIIDGHNDLPLAMRLRYNNDVWRFPFEKDLTRMKAMKDYFADHTDLPRLRKGHIGAQWWAAWCWCNATNVDAVQVMLEQMDATRLLVRKYPNDMMFAESVSDIQRGMKEGKIASLIGVEGGHAIGNSLAILRVLYNFGARYMTLTHNCPTDSAEADYPPDNKFHKPARSNGLSKFGRRVVYEMNRLGMIVDISHTSRATMLDVLDISLAPPMFSHSNARGVCNHPRNVPDDVLLKVKERDGIVMVLTYPDYLREDHKTQEATVKDVAKHIEHIRKLIGVNHIGIGGDFNGIPRVAKGWKSVDETPNVFHELMMSKDYKWTEEDLRKVAQENFLRIFRKVEKVRDIMARDQYFPFNKWIKYRELEVTAENNETRCRHEDLLSTEKKLIRISF